MAACTWADASPVLRVCVVGAGAIGGFLGTRLAAAGEASVAALARGTTLVALRDHGWRLEKGATRLQAPAATVSDDPRDLGPQDLIIITVKGPGTAGPRTQPCAPHRVGHAGAVGDERCALVVQRRDRGSRTRPLESVDPGGGIAATIAGRQVIGCVVHASAATAAPGITLHRMGRGLIIGEPAGGSSARVRALGELLTRAGFEVTCSRRIRHDIWYKLWGNMTMNPVSALTGATMDRVLDDAWCVPSAPPPWPRRPPSAHASAARCANHPMIVMP